MFFRFPAIRTTRTKDQQVRKIVDEVNEYLEAGHDDQEAVDILHAVETFIRVHFQGREEVLDQLVNLVIQKNTARGYYSKDCF